MFEENSSKWLGRDPLLWILNPTTLDEFIDSYWERSALIVRRQSADYYKELLTFDDVNAFMSRNDIRYPYLRLVKNGREIPLVDYADDFVYGSNIFPGLLDNDKVFSHFANGATLSFQIFQKCMDGLSRFCNALEARLKFQTQVNIFVTPPNSKGFTSHYDDHSFFILQISGSKHWNLYGNPIELPLQEFRRKTVTPDLGEPRQITLHAGDLLYLPKGFYHDALTTDSTSVHITLGIFPYPWIQIMERLVEKMKDDVDFRRAPAEYLRSSDNSKVLQPEFDALIKKMGETRVAPLLDELIAKAASKQIVDGKDRLLDITRIGSITGTSRLRRRNVLIKLVPSGNGLRLSFYDKSITFPAVAGDALKFIVESDTFSVDQMPTRLSAVDNCVVVKKLVKEGLLTLVNS